MEASNMRKESEVQLRSSDNEIIDVDKEVAIEFEHIKNIIDDTGKDHIIPIQNVTPNILAKVIQYYEYHIKAPKSSIERNVAVNSEEEVRKWDEEFVKVDQTTLLDLIQAANYLKLKKLLDLTCQTVADMITGRSPEEIREIFNITNDFTPEEEAEIRSENQWAFH